MNFQRKIFESSNILDTKTVKSDIVKTMNFTIKINNSKSKVSETLYCILVCS